MGQILSSISGDDTTSQKKKRSSLSSRQFSQHSPFDISQRKSESGFFTSQRSYDTEWLEKKIRQQEVEKIYQARQQEAERLLQARQARQQEAERLLQARKAREQEAERLLQARKAREQEAERLLQAKKAREQEVIKLLLARRQEKASQVSRNTTSLSNRSYNVVTTSERKLTSLGTKGNPTSFSDPYSISSISEGNTTSLSREDRENIKRITEIVRNILARNKNYVVYGNWSCPHWPNSCSNEEEWQCKHSLESFRRYLKLNQKSKKDFFMNKCKGCDNKSLITSFFLYDRQPKYASKEPTIEIVCRLVWNNHYRVFAEWKCGRPQYQHKWKSSYTWISLRNYIESSPLKEGDYYVQKCYECREQCKVCKKKPKEERGCEKCDHDTVILSHSPLVQSPGGKPHKRWLCAKCKGGSICRSDNNYRVPRKRNIELDIVE